MRNRLKAFLHLQGCLLLLLGQAPFGFAQGQEFLVDTAQSEVSFEIMHMGLLTVEGKFRRFEGRFVMDNDEVSAIHGKIDVSSLDTDDEIRDKTIKSGAYLDADSFPTIQFQSTQVDFDAQEIIGILTIKGVSKSIKMPFKNYASKEGTEITFHITTTINRKDFELDFGPMDALIGDEITIKLKIFGKK